VNTLSSAIVIATRGSALALAQANLILGRCREAFPQLTFEIKIVKTTGDKLQTASLANPGSMSKGLFTKELEVALEQGEADLAVHSLKDLPTELPAGLELGAVSERADVRDVLIQRSAEKGNAPPGLEGLSQNATVATGSTRRRAQLLMHRPDLKVVEIRGNVGTRLQKLADQSELDAIVLAAAGLERLNIRVTAERGLEGESVPGGLWAAFLEPGVMLPCVGQGALGIEVRANDPRAAMICGRLNHLETQQCVSAEREFLSAMGGGCQSPVAAYADRVKGRLRLRGISFLKGRLKRGETSGAVDEAESLGRRLAVELRP